MNVDGHLHHQLIPHREQSALFGISSSSSVHAQPPLLADEFPPQLMDPTALWHRHHHHHHLALPPPQQQDNQFAINLSYQSFPTMFSYEPHEECAQPGAREKRHCCQLCTKRFDRPSTLKKHMLVHTGEKAWACAICGRRFSVSSNLNRHARRCKEKWSKSDSLATGASPSSALSDPSESAESPPSSSSPSSSSDGSDAYGPTSPQLTDHLKRRQSAPALVQYETDDGPRSHDQPLIPGLASRKRRKGSPTDPWVPASLVTFNLDPGARFMPTPLPAVVPSTCEERNSYADTPLQAYHPACWAGHLVGPSYSPRSDEMARGHYCGKLLVF